MWAKASGAFAMKNSVARQPPRAVSSQMPGNPHSRRRRSHGAHSRRGALLVHRIQYEGVDVRGFLDLLGDRLARAMTCPALDADQDRMAVGIRMLHSRRELEAVRRKDPIIMVGGGDERC